MNISFDNITLQDACDILNCGSPYKMRVLLEKRAAPPKLTDKLTKSPPPRALYYGSQLALVPEGSSLSINQRQQLSATSSGGALNATKSYFKRLANLVSPIGNSNRARISHHNNNNPHLDYRNQHEFGTTSSALSISGKINCSNELLANGHIPYLGSAAARRNLFSGGVPQFTSESLNQASSDTQQTTIAQQVIDQTTFEEAHILTSRAPITTSCSMSAQQRCLSHSDSIGSNLRGRFSVDSEAEMLNVGSSTNDFNTVDSSLDYQNRNANHRLHGPQFDNRVGQRMQVEDITDLRMIAQSQNQLNSSHSRTATAVARRQSVACNLSNSKDLSSNHHHLEQTQSQPEIALRESSRERETTTSIMRQHSGDVVDERIEILPNSRSSNLQATAPNTRDGRFQMMSSVSTPSVNLLGSSNQTQQSNSATTLNNSSSSTSGGDWPKVSSLRRKKQLQQHQELKESIREETGGGSDSSYADSTSKLVEKKQGQQTTGTSSNGSRANQTSASNLYHLDTDNSRPTVTQIARNLELKVESLSSSSSVATATTLANNSRDTLTSLVNRNKAFQTEEEEEEEDYRD